MQKLLYQQLKKLKKELRNYLKKESSLVDIFVIGSMLKNKEKPNDIDIVTLFRVNNVQKIEDVNYAIKKIVDNLDLSPHIEPLYVDNFFSREIFKIIFHEGFSIKHNEFLHRLQKINSFILFTYTLLNKKASDKVRFSYALYGRKKGEGFLHEIKGKEIGRGAVIIPIQEAESAKNFFKQWDVSYTEQRILVYS